MSNSMDDIVGEWRPPVLTEAEKIAVRAKQKEREQLSNAMGQYLLKGYRMLDSTCSECGNILLRVPRGDSDYCISCEELGHSKKTCGPELPPPQAIMEIKEDVASESAGPQGKPQDLSDTEQALTLKIQWATKELSQNTSVDYSTQLCVLMQQALKALGKLKKFQEFS